MESSIERFINNLKGLSELYDQIANRPDNKDTEYGRYLEQESQEFYKIANDISRVFKMELTQ